MARGKGSAGKFRPSRQNVSKIVAKDGNIYEYQTGRGDVDLSGANYRGGAGASFVGIRKAARSAKTNRIQIAIMIRRTSKDRGFRWVQSNTRTVSEFMRNIDTIDAGGGTVDDLAKGLLALDYPVQGAITWRVIEVHGQRG